MKTIEGWKTYRVRDICDLGRGRVISGKEIELNPGVFPVYSSQSSNNGKMGSIDTYDFDGEYVTWTTDGAYAGTVFYRSGKFNCTNVCGTLHAKESHVFMPFIAYKLSTLAKDHVSYVGNPKLMNGVMANIELAIPASKPEQTKIAEILSTVDQAIEQTEALIAKQQRIKTGLMQDLLTRGIDEHGNIRSEQTHKFKDSPLGRIPFEWDVVSLQSLASKDKHSIVDGPFGSNLKTIHYRDLGIPIIQSGFVTKGIFMAEQYLFVDEGKFKSEIRSKAVPSDIIMAKIGARCGMCAILPDDHPISIIAGNCIKISVSKDNSNKYVLAFLQFDYERTRFEDIISTTAQPAISMSALKKKLIKKPSLQEQQSISQAIDNVSCQFDMDQKTSSKLISVKTALMQDLLTGRKRVTPLLKDEVITG